MADLSFDDLYNSVRFPKLTKNELDDPYYQVSSDEWNALIRAVANIVSGGATQYALYFDNGTPSIINTSESNPCLTFTPRFTAQQGASEPAQQSALISYRVTTIVGSTEVEVASGSAATGSSVSVPIQSYLTAGSSTTFTIYGTEGNTSTTGSLSFAVTYTSLALDCSNYNWQEAWVSNDSSFSLGIFNCSGAVSKVLHVKLTVGNYTKEYTKNLGTSTGSFSLTSSDGLVFPTVSGTAATGTMEAWLESSSIETEHQTFPLMCVKSAYASTASLLAVHHVIDTLTNNASNDIFEYAIYSKGATSGSVTVTIDGVGDTFTAATETQLTYRTDVDITTDESEYNVLCRISCGSQYASYSIPLDNSSSYPATSGAAFYMNPATRSNGQSNYASIINQVDQSSITATWTRMAWDDSTDGWTVDDDSRQCLYIPATSRCNIAYQPLASGVGNGLTIEFTYKVKNVADFDDVIISVCDDRDSDTFIGVRIKPNNITLHSSLTKSTDNDPVQGYDVIDEQEVNVVIVFTPSYFSGASNTGAAMIYVNGVKKMTMAYNSADSWLNTGNIILGSDNSDLYIYNIRVYNSSLGWYSVLQNYTNSHIEDQAAIYSLWQSILDGDIISFDKVRAAYNCFTVEMTEGSVSSYHPELYQLPTFGHEKAYSAVCNFEMFFASGRSLSIANAQISGQGTTSMNYWIWNLRWRMDKDTGAVTTYDDDTTSEETCDFFGDGTDMVRITAKKNFASSSQGHKMGTCMAFNDLHDALVGPNEVNGRVAVYQVPAYGFLKVPLEDGTGYGYVFLGLYTIGADKGDKPTFNWNTCKSTLLDLEGPDHDPKLTSFAYPWTSDVVVYDSFVTIALGNGNYQNGWEVGNAMNQKTDANIQTVIETYWRPAYLVAYNNSTRILPVPDGYTISSMNADVNAFIALRDDDGNPYEYYEFWDSNYDLYYLDQVTKQYTKGVNLLTDLGVSSVDGSTNAEKNESIKALRRARFKANMETYWDLDDALFTFVFQIVYGVSDNFNKNTYPYNIDPTQYKFRWRSDDDDTIFQVDNQGLFTKTYSIEYKDFTDDAQSAYVFKGAQSVFWTLIAETYPDEIRTMGYNLLDAMANAASTSGKAITRYGASSIGKLMQYFYDVYWDRVAGTFPRSAFNLDAAFAYESAYPYLNNGYNVDVSPIEQSRGDSVEAEENWVYRRMVYCMSLFNYGSFGDYTDQGLGLISFRTQTQQALDITPAIDLYPAILGGQSGASRATSRVKAGDSVSLLTGGGNTNAYIVAANWIEDIGDLCTLSVDSGTDISLAGKRLSRIKIGDSVASNVTSILNGINVGSCPCLLLFDARNLTTLSSAVDLSKCPRLQRAYFTGTQITQVNLASGSKIRTLTLPETISVISFINLKFLRTFTYASLANLYYLRLENTPSIDMLEMLSEAYNASNSQLRAIRLVGMDSEGDANDLAVIRNIAKDINADGDSYNYYGIDSNGNEDTSSVPVLEGSITIDGSCTQEDYELVTSTWPSLNVTLTQSFYITFADSKTLQILLNNGVGDGVGITTDAAAAVERLNNEGSSWPWFRGTDIETFDEFMYFTGLEQFISYMFADCASLTSIVMPNTGTMALSSTFRNCTSLTSVTIPEGVAPSSTDYVFANCSSLQTITLPSTWTKIGHMCFHSCSSLNITIPDTVTHIGYHAFEFCTSLTSGKYFASMTNANYSEGCYRGCTALKNITFGSGVTEIASYAFDSDSALAITSLPSTLQIVRDSAFYGCKKMALSSLPSSITTIGTNAFSGCSAISATSLPSSLTSLGEGAFRNCTSLAITSIPSAITEIASSVFEGCSGISISALNDTVTAIGSKAFMNCTGVTLSAWPSGMSGVTEIASYSFYMSGVQFTTIPSSVTTIGTAAFWGCTSLTSMYLHDNITTIEAGAFNACRNLAITHLPSGLTSISDRCFAGCDLSAITSLPSGVTSIGDFAFADAAVLGFSSLPSGVTSIGAGAFYGNTFAAFTSMPSSLLTIGNDAFNGSHVNFTIPSGVTTIGSRAFVNSRMTDATLPSSLTSIGANAFQGSSITQFVMAECSVTELSGERICYSCAYLDLVDLPANITSISNECFYHESHAISVVKVRATTPPTLGNNVFKSGTKIYVPASALSAYKSATKWSDYADDIDTLDNAPS